MVTAKKQKELECVKCERIVSKLTLIYYDLTEKEYLVCDKCLSKIDETYERNQYTVLDEVV